MDVQARLARLEACEAIRRTLAEYGHAIDAGDEAAWVGLFTDDGEFRVSDREGRGYTVSGRAELEAFVARHSRAPEALHEHVVTQPVIDVDGDRATVRSRFFVIVMDGDRPVVRAFGTYVDDLRRSADDGRWRFRVRAPLIDAAAPGLPPLAGGRG